MASKELNVKLKQRYDTASNWTTNNPVLLAGELGIESDTKKMKVGDGTTSWNSLAYMIATPELPNNIAYTDKPNTFTSPQTLVGGFDYGDNGLYISGLITPSNSNTGYIGVKGFLIRSHFEDHILEIGHSALSKIISPNIIQAQGLTDGTITKTMTEILEGGGGSKIIWREWK